MTLIPNGSPDGSAYSHATVFSGDTSFEEVLEALGAPTVTLAPLHATTFSGGEPRLHPVPGSFSVVNAETGELLTRRGNAVVVGRRYTPIQYTELKPWWEAFKGGHGVKSIEAGLCEGGSSLYIRAELDLPDSENLAPYTVFRAGHDGVTQAKGMAEVRNFWCFNMMPSIVRSAKKNGTYLQVRHTTNALTAIEVGAKAFTMARGDLRSTLQLFKAAGRTRMNDAQFADMLDELRPVPEEEGRGRTVALRLHEQLQTNFECGRGIREAGIQGTAWAGLNAVTEYTTHQQGVRVPEGTPSRLLLERKLDSTWDGIGADFNRRTLEYVRAFVGEGAA